MKRRVLTALLCGALLCGMVPMAASAAETAAIPGAEKEKFTFYGRTALNAAGAVQLFWTNSGFAVKVSGATTVTAEIDANAYGVTNSAYLNVYVDGAFEPTSTVILNRESGTYTLAENLSAGEHIIEVRKRNEAAYGGTAAATGAKVMTDGAFLTPPAKPTRQIEFIGDSITSGFGNLITDGSGDYTSATVDGTMTYAVLAAKQLGAQAQVLSRSGIGYCRNTLIHNTLDSSFYPHYTKTAALPGVGVGNMAWDFENNPSDVVVINLGTNDNGGTRDGRPITDAEMTDEAVAFLELVREKNPDAIIIWHYGMMGSPRAAALEDAVAERNDAGDEKVYFLQQAGFSSVTEGVGTHGHPTVQANINRSDELARFIAEKTGWEWNAAPMLKAQLQWSAQYNNEDTLAALAPLSKSAFTEAIAEAKALLQAENVKNEDLVAASETVWRAWADRRFLSDMAEEYIVVDTCDDTNGAQIRGSGKKGFDYDDAKEGAASLYTSGSGLLCINHVNAYNIPLPSDVTSWFLECWLYVDQPDRMPNESVLEFSQAVDTIEISWSLRQLGLQAGWNKLQLPLTSLPSNMTTLRSVRVFLNGVTEPITMKLDHIVLSKGRVAANTEVLDAVAAEAQGFLAEHHSKMLEEALKEAKSALSQADVDAQVMKLAAAIAAAEKEKAFLAGDADGDGKVDSTDARLVLQHAVGKIDKNALDVAAADADGDGKIDSTDARLILQKAVGKIDKFPIEG